MLENGVRSLAETLGEMPRGGTVLESVPSASVETMTTLELIREQIKQADSKILFSRANIPPRAVKVLRDHGYRPGRWDKARKALEQCYANEGIALLCGQRKTGKTVLATAVAITLIANGKMACYTRGLGLLQDLRRHHNENDRDSFDYTLPYRRWPMLIVDEVGVRVRGDQYSESDAALFTDLIDQRYANRVSTILVSNENAAESFKILGPSITRRIEETGIVIEADWGEIQ